MKGKKGEKSSMFGVILSQGPDVFCALLFFPLQRKHTDNLKNMQEPKHGFGLF